ncbi:MAG: erythromycin biosynthesis sensory transduction protein eryC1, partial [Calditrichaeota bacterium]
AGRTSKYEHVLEGFNHRLDTLQAAVLKIKLKYLDEWNAKRRKIAALYQGYFSNHEKIRTVTEPDGFEGVYHLFVIQVEDRDRVRKALQEKGISTGIHYPICLHLQPAYQYLGYPQGAFPVAEQAAAKLLSLPIFPEMSEDMVEYVANQVIQAV